MLFSSSPSDVCVVVPSQWWRIIGTSERLTSVYLKIITDRVIYQQKLCFVMIIAPYCWLNGQIPVQSVPHPANPYIQLL
ncbi:hypothetical protein CEQ28_006870 [Hafnia alvei]|nr:hypothetical protein CEQ28_006870 [Hafnia alvei]